MLESEAMSIMDKKRAIKMIDEYLLEPNNISKEWVECLRLCRMVLAESKSPELPDS